MFESLMVDLFPKMIIGKVSMEYFGRENLWLCLSYNRNLEMN